MSEIGTTRKHRDFDRLAEVSRELYQLCGTLLEALGDCATTDDAALRCAAALGTVNASGQVIDHAEELLRKLGVEVEK